MKNIKLLALSFLVLNSTCVFANNFVTNLNLYQETALFKIFCTMPDETVAKLILDSLNTSYTQLTLDFNHTYSCPITIKIYPDLKSFHHAIGKDNAPDWLISSYGDHCHKIVSPNNPGSYHTYDSVMRCTRIGIVTLFLQDKYPLKNSPRWLLQGISFHKTNFYSPERLALAPAEIPTITQLEEAESDDLKFAEIKGFTASQLLVQFIIERWGWQTVLNLLENYDKFEEVLNISKPDLHSALINSRKTKS